MQHTHVIHKVFVEINVSEKDQANEIRNHIGQYLSRNVLPQLEKLLDQQQKSVQYALQVDNLVLEVQPEKVELNKDLENRITEQFQVALDSMIDDHMVEKAFGVEMNTKVNLMDKADHDLSVFIHFLKSGTKPWWSNDDIHALFEVEMAKNLVKTNGFKKQFTDALRDDKIRRRLVNQFPKAVLEVLTTKIVGHDSLVQGFLDLLQSLDKSSRKRSWLAVLDVLVKSPNLTFQAIEMQMNNVVSEAKLMKTEGETSHQRNRKKTSKLDKIDGVDFTTETSLPTLEEKADEEGKQVLNEVSKDRLKPNVKPEERAKQTESLPIDKDPIEQGETRKPIQAFELNPSLETPSQPLAEASHYINHLGLVLMHPFLVHFFKKCNLLTAENRLNDPVLGVHLLHFMATGKMQQAESEMVFEKFLCGIPIETSIPRDIVLSEDHIQEAENAIRALIQNWEGLKTASIDLIRHEFLQRSGKLDLSETGATISIEQKTQDILLKKITWGLGLIKLPWHTAFIYVHW